MINHLLKFSISSMALFSLWGCHSTNSEYINTGMCRGEEYDVDEQDCVAGSLVDACNDKNLYSIIHSKDVAYACRGDSSWTEASKNEVYFERGCDKGNENATLEYGYSTMVCIQDTSHTWKWVVDSEVEASRLNRRVVQVTRIRLPNHRLQAASRNQVRLRKCIVSKVL